MHLLYSAKEQFGYTLKAFPVWGDEIAGIISFEHIYNSTQNIILFNLFHDLATDKNFSVCCDRVCIYTLIDCNVWAVYRDMGKNIFFSKTHTQRLSFIVRWMKIHLLILHCYLYDSWSNITDSRCLI